MANALPAAPLVARLGHAAMQTRTAPPAAAPLRQAAWRHRGQRCCRAPAAVQARHGAWAGPGLLVGTALPVTTLPERSWRRC